MMTPFFEIQGKLKHLWILGYFRSLTGKVRRYSVNKIGLGVWAYGSCCDRYVSEGYRPCLPLRERLVRARSIEGIEGVEITYPGDLNSENYNQYEPLLTKSGLSITAVGVELVCDKEWQWGSFTSPDEKIREKAKNLVKGAMDFAESRHVEIINLWLGQDGFDYFLQANYPQQWDWLVEGLKECADYRPRIKLGLEYKVSEPKLSCIIKSGGMALALAQCTGRENVGVTMDVGHALNARENPGEMAAILLRQNKLFHLHLNDNYMITDDDMPIGSVHFLHFVELFFWLREMGYEGWYSLDMYPYRDDPDEAAKASVYFVRHMENFVERKLGEYSFTEVAKKAPARMLKELYEKILI
jgi:xylose isomerase